jgi:peptidyl-prolyl cis-trans isomerase D
MLERFAARFQTFVLAFLVLLISVVFILQFGGPQAEGCSNLAGGGLVAQVYSEAITPKEFQGAYRMAGFDQVDPEAAETYGLREIVLDGLVERVLLAREARRIGFAVSEDEVMRRLAEEGTAYLSLGIRMPDFLRQQTGPSGERFLPVKDEDGRFDKDAAKRFIQYRLRRSVAEFADSQVQEALAHRMRELMLSTATVGPEEVWNRYVQDTERATIAYLRFAPSWYRRQVEGELTPATLDAYVADHRDELDAAYETQKHRFTGLEKQVRARHILFKAEGDDEAVDAQAREAADAVLARLQGGEDFAALARELSEDSGSASKGGDLGWNPRGRMVPAFDEAQFALEPGERTQEPVKTRFGYHVIEVLGVREGDVPEDEAKRELAEEMFLEEEAKVRARAAAEAALAKLRDGATLAAVHRDLTGRPLDGAAEGDDDDDGGGDVATPDAPAAAQGTDDDGDAAGKPLPELDPLAPQVRTAGPFGRSGQPITGSFDSSPLAQAAFEELSPDEPLPEAPMELGGEFIVYRLEERTVAQRGGLTPEVRARLEAELVEAKGQEILEIFIARLRDEAEADGALRVEESFFDGAAADDQV